MKRSPAAFILGKLRWLSRPLGFPDRQSNGLFSSALNTGLSVINDPYRFHREPPSLAWAQSQPLSRCPCDIKAVGAFTEQVLRQLLRNRAVDRFILAKRCDERRQDPLKFHVLPASSFVA